MMSRLALSLSTCCTRVRCPSDSFAPVLCCAAPRMHGEEFWATDERNYGTLLTEQQVVYRAAAAFRRGGLRVRRTSVYFWTKAAPIRCVRFVNQNTRTPECVDSGDDARTNLRRYSSANEGGIRGLDKLVSARSSRCKNFP